MPKKKTVFVCADCGFDSPKWSGKCPNCGAWNTMAEQTVSEERRASVPRERAVPVAITEIGGQAESRMSTGVGELDRVLGGGMVGGSLVLVSGEPGIGKSTLLLQVCAKLSGAGRVLYVTGEESQAQIKMRAARIGALAPGIVVYAETELQAALEEAARLGPALMVVDSIQTLYHPAFASTPGSVTQVRECAMMLMQYAKSSGVPVVLVGHVNKDGGIAGPKVLEHMVDTVVSFEGDRHANYRLIRAVKNRFGSVSEIGMFEMTGRGLAEVPNPSAALLSGRPEGASGSCVAATLEGTRPLLAEIQALVTKSAYGAARRMAAGVDYNRAVLLLAILEKRAGFMLGAYDAYVNVVGGLSLDEPGVDLAAAIAIASSYLDKPVRLELAAFGEVGLSGEVRSVSGAELRVHELRRLGFKSCILPKSCLPGLNAPEGIELIGVSDLRDAIRQSFE